MNTRITYRDNHAAVSSRTRVWLLSFLVVVFVPCMIAPLALVAQQSAETFGTIRLEHHETPGATISLMPPSGVTNYALTLPATTSVGTWQLGFSVNSAAGTAYWAPAGAPVGLPTHIPYFSDPTTLTGNPLHTWNDGASTLSVNGTTSSSTLFSIAKSGTLSSSHNSMVLSNTATSATASVNKTALVVSASGAMGSASAVTGVDVDVAGGTNNVAALFRNGRVGVGLGTSLPVVGFDNATDASNREFNYTGALSVGTTPNHNVEFTAGNRASFIRIATTGLSGDFQITGLAGGQDGKYIHLVNATNQTMILRHDNTGSSAANRFITTTQYDLSLPPRTGAAIQYSATAQRWLVVSAGVSSYTALAFNSKTVTTGDDQLPTSNAAYVLVNNSAGNNFRVYFEDGIALGQIICVQNNGPNSLRISDGATINVEGVNLSMPTEAAVLFIWDGAKWNQMAAASN
jgi:hypothetical protein